MLPRSKTIHESARSALRASADSSRRLILIYAGILTGASAILTVLTYLLGTMANGEGGLANFGMISILLTIQQVLPILQTALMLGLEYSYARGILELSRGEKPTERVLLSGFYRFGGVLTYTLLQLLLYMGVMLLCFMVAYRIYLLTPLSDPLMELLEPYVAATVLTPEDIMTPELSAAVMQATLPLLLFFAAVSIAVMIPIAYSLCQVRFLLMEDTRIGASAAMRQSRKMMKGNKLAMLRLDISMWWYYVPSFLLTAVCYGDSILPMLGVELPMSSDAAYFLFYFLYLAGQFALFYFGLNPVTMAYAKAYEALKPREEALPAVVEQG